MFFWLDLVLCLFHASTNFFGVRQSFFPIVTKPQFFFAANANCFVSIFGLINEATRNSMRLFIFAHLSIYLLIYPYSIHLITLWNSLQMLHNLCFIRYSTRFICVLTNMKMLNCTLTHGIRIEMDCNMILCFLNFVRSLSWRFSEKVGKKAALNGFYFNFDELIHSQAEVQILNNTYRIV